MPEIPALAKLADHLLDEGIATFITEHRAAGLSWDRIARELWARTDKQVDTSGVTVQSWADRLADQASTKAAS